MAPVRHVPTPLMIIFLDLTRFTAQDLLHLPVFLGGQIVFANEFGSDGRSLHQFKIQWLNSSML